MIDSPQTRYFMYGIVSNVAPFIKDTYQVDLENCWLMKAMPTEDHSIDFVSEKLADGLLGKGVCVEIGGAKVISFKTIDMNEDGGTDGNI